LLEDGPEIGIKNLILENKDKKNLFNYSIFWVGRKTLPTREFWA